MQPSDPRWTGRWSKVHFSSPLQNFSSAVSKRAAELGFGGFGTDDEPESSLWLASLSEAIGERFCENSYFLDYGCGAGRYAEFLRRRLKHFGYFGLEKSGSDFQHGEKSLAAGKEIFHGDDRIRFGVIGSAFEANAFARADVVVLGSILTHVDLEELKRIFEKCEPVVQRGGKVVFSIFIADRYYTEGPGAYGFKDCYGRVWFTAEQLGGLCDERGWIAVERESFLAQEVNLHRIFLLTSRGEFFGGEEGKRRLDPPRRS